MRVRATAVTAAVGAVAGWMAVPLLSLALGRSLDDRCRARLRDAGPAASARGPVVVPLQRTRPAPGRPAWASVPAPRPAADAVHRVG